MALVLLLTCAAFAPCLSNGFVNWDDNLYVTDNPVIRNFSFQGLKQILTSFSVGNYQPVTLLSYLFEFRIFSLNPFGYHLVSLILHLINCLLVFWLVYLFSRRVPVALATAALFALHPLHVESVAWVSQRKDLLYVLFFLASLIAYLYYLRTRRIGKFYYFALILFFVSLLSKAMAIILPIILLCLDDLTKRIPDKNRFKDKIPFFILSFIFGVVALIGQYSSRAIRGESLINIWAKFVNAVYSIIFYLDKILMPVKLSCLYPRTESRFSPALLILPVIYIAFCLGLYLLNKGRKKIVFANAFFLISLLPVLQFVPLGEAIVADRYMYLASIGIFYFIAECLVWLYQNKLKPARLIRVIFLVSFICLSMILVLLTRQRCLAWKNSVTLWNDVLDKYPRAAMAYYNRAVAYNSMKDYPRAIADFNRLTGVVSDIDRRMIYLYLVNLYRSTGQNNLAAEAYNKVKKIDAELFRQYVESAGRYREAGNNNQAIILYKQALELDPGNLALRNDLGITYIYAGEFGEAAALFKKLLEDEPDSGLFYNNLALVYYYEKKYALAIEYCDRALNSGYPVSPRLLSWLKSYRR